MKHIKRKNTQARKYTADSRLENRIKRLVLAWPLNRPGCVTRNGSAGNFFQKNPPKTVRHGLTSPIRGQLEAYMADEQAGFRKDRRTTQQILMLRLPAEKDKRKGMKIYNCFVNFQKAFDSLDQKSTWAIMKSYGIEKTSQNSTTHKHKCKSCSVNQRRIG